MAFTHAQASTRGASHRAQLWHRPRKNHQLDAETSTTARSNSRKDLEHLGPNNECGRPLL